jgi:hypothetical protein
MFFPSSECCAAPGDGERRVDTMPTNTGRKIDAVYSQVLSCKVFRIQRARERIRPCSTYWRMILVKRSECFGQVKCPRPNSMRT